MQSEGLCLSCQQKWDDSLAKFKATGAKQSLEFCDRCFDFVLKIGEEIRKRKEMRKAIGKVKS